MYDLQMGKFLGLRCEVAFIVLRVIKESYFYHTVSIAIKRPFYTLPWNRKYLKLLFRLHLKNITGRSWMREERKRIFDHFFIIIVLSLIERKRLINTAIMSVFHLLIAQFHLLRAFRKKKRKIWPVAVDFNGRRYKKTSGWDAV